MSPYFAHAANTITEDSYENNLLGHWGGLRDLLVEAGVDASVRYKSTYWRVADGGLKTGSNYNDNLDVLVAFDGEKLWGVKGSRALIYFLNNSGSPANLNRIGSVQGIDNIEVNVDTAKLYEAWVAQSFYEGKIDVLVGLHDLNAEYAVTDASLNFNMPVMQVPQSLAQSGPLGPSIFPNTALAARIQVKPTENSYISAAVFNALAGNPSQQKGTHVNFDFNRGLLLISEVGYTPSAADSELKLNKIALGGWGYTQKANDLLTVDAGGNPVRHTQAGAYLVSSARLYHNEVTGRDVSGFIRGGVADGDTAQVDWDYEVGLIANGWLPTRSDGELGVGFAQAHNGPKYHDSVGAPSDSSESGIELYYRDTLCRGVVLQPDFQYIINPGSNPAVANATVFGLRLDVNL